MCNRDEWIEDIMNDLYIDCGYDNGLLDSIFSDACEEASVDENDYHWQIVDNAIVVIRNPLL